MGIIKSFLAIITLVVSFTISAQEIIISQPINDDGGYGGSGGVGQSFIAPFTADITAIAVLPFRDVTATLSIFDNAMATGTPIYTQSGISLVQKYTTDPFQVITLDNSVPITIGQSYSFVFENINSSVVLYVADNNIYADGTVLARNSSGSYNEAPSFDLAFQIYGSSKPVVAAPKAIPSLSVFGLLSLMMLVVGFGVRSRNSKS